MGFFSKIFGSQNMGPHTAAAPAPQPQQRSLIESVQHDIEMTEGELHEAEELLAAATDNEIKTSLNLLVARKTHAIADLQEKMRDLQKNNIT